MVNIENNGLMTLVLIYESLEFQEMFQNGNKINLHLG